VDAQERIEVEIQIAPGLTDQAAADQLSSQRLGAVVELALRGEGASGELTLVITDDQGIQELNRDFLGHDAPTDVLAFGAREDGGPFVTAPEAGGYLGDVIVSLPRATAQAAEMGHSLQQELDLLIVHGVLHLLGYDHASEEDKARMWARQSAILDEVWPASD
jgi:probable rRNA maturation factor